MNFGKSSSHNQKFGDYQLPPKADDDEESQLNEVYMRELLKQAGSDEELRHLLFSQNPSLFSEFLQMQGDDSSAVDTTSNTRQNHLDRPLSLNEVNQFRNSQTYDRFESFPNSSQNTNYPPEQDSMGSRSHSGHDGSVPGQQRLVRANSSSLRPTKDEKSQEPRKDNLPELPLDHLTTEYITSKFNREYADLKEKYKTALDLAFFFSSLVQQQQLQAEQLKKAHAHREIEVTTLKQNIEALNSALRRTQKATAPDRQKHIQLIDRVLKDYDNIVNSLQEKDSLLEIIEQQKNHIIEQGKLIEALKNELGLREE